MTIPSTLHCSDIAQIEAAIAVLPAKLKDSSKTTLLTPTTNRDQDYLDPFSDIAIYKPNGDFHENGERVLRLKFQVLQLISDLFPSSETGPPQISLIGEGSYNIVISVKIRPANVAEKRDSGVCFSEKLTRLLGIPPKARDFALRLPLDAHGELQEAAVNDVDRDVATLSVVGNHLTLPVPKVVEYDLGSSNSIGRPYMLQTQLTGTNFNYLWRDLNLAQKISAIAEITKLAEKVSTLTAPAAGTISPSNLASPGSRIQLDDFPIPTKYQAEKEADAAPFPGSSPAQHHTPLTYLLGHMDRWMTYEKTLPYNTPRTKPLWTALKVILHSLHKKGWLGDTFHLAHNDLFPRNILARITSPSTVSITGVVDWDMASFAPLAVALRAPFWAWKASAADEQDEDVARVPVAGEERVALKKTFLDAASERYKAFGLGLEAIVVRKVWRLAVEGLGSEVAKSVARELVDQWGEMYPEDDAVEVWMDVMAKMVVNRESEWDN